MRSAWTTNKNVSEPPAFLCLPNRCRRSVRRPQRTKSDWALEVAHLLDTRYAKCEQVTLVSDHLNTHTMGAFYEAFPPEQARAYVKRRNLVHTPKHGSWLNIAECERSCLTSQCLAGRRIGCLKFLQSEIATWSQKNNTASIGNSNSKTPEQNSKSSTPKLRPDKAPRGCAVSISEIGALLYQACDRKEGRTHGCGRGSSVWVCGLPRR